MRVLSFIKKNIVPFLYWEQAVIVGIMAVILIAGIDWGLPTRERMFCLTGGIIDDAALRAISAKQKELKALHKSRQKGIQDVQDDYIPYQQRKNYVLTEEDLVVSFRSFSIASSAHDERRGYSAIANMNPRTFDFNPKWFLYGGSYLYPTGVVLFMSQALGFFTANSDLAYCVRHPEEVAFLYLVGRGINILAFLGILLLLSRFGYVMNGRLCGTLAMLAWSCSSLGLLQSLIGKPHVYAAFWILLSLYCAYQHTKTGSFATLMLAGIMLGWGAGASLSSASVWLMLVVLLTDVHNVQMSVKRILAVTIVSVAVYFFTNPYVITSFAAFSSQIIATGASKKWGYDAVGIGKAVPFFKEVFLNAYAFPISLVSIAGVIAMIGNKETRQRRFAIGSALLVLFLMMMPINARVAMFLGPILCLCAGYALSTFYNRVTPGLKAVAAAGISIAFVLPLFFVGVFMWEIVHDDCWLPVFKEWIQQTSSQKVTYGILTKKNLNPVHFPPFPFIHSSVMNLEYYTPGDEKPDYVLLSRKQKDMLSWREHPLYGEYQLAFTYGNLQGHDFFPALRKQSDALIAGHVFKHAKN